MILVIFLSVAALRGFYAIFMKLAQREYVTDLKDSLYMIVLISFYQVIFLFILPPYYPMEVSVKMVAYPAVFGLLYIFTLTFLLGAYGLGSASLSTVIQNFSMFVPIAAGVLLWKETIGISKIIGIALFVGALLLFNKGTYKSEGTEKRITFKWVIVILGATFFAGLSSLTSKLYALEYGHNPKEYLIISNFLVVVCGSLYFTWLYKRGKYKPSFKGKLMGYSALIGLLADIVNIVFMEYVASFDSAFFFPMLSSTSIIAVVIMGRIFLKEQVSKKAYGGILLCIAAIFLLNR